MGLNYRPDRTNGPKLRADFELTAYFRLDTKFYAKLRL